MPWLDQAADLLAAQPVCGYRRDWKPSVEPTALAALALVAAGRNKQATPALDWLVRIQSTDGSLGIDADTHEPCWPTGWAVLAWNALSEDATNAKSKWAAAAKKAVAWMLSVRGVPVARETEDSKLFGHDTTLQGWPWVVGTHSWVEPTAINLMALRSADLGSHERAREAVALLLDRQLPEGGWNYGNTTVFGHMLRPHVEATGLALAALAGETNIRQKVKPSLDWLQRTLSPRTTAASLSYAILGLVGHRHFPKEAGTWLEATYQSRSGVPPLSEHRSRSGVPPLSEHRSRSGVPPLSGDVSDKTSTQATRQDAASTLTPYHIALLVLAAKKAQAHGFQV